MYATAHSPAIGLTLAVAMLESAIQTDRDTGVVKSALDHLARELSVHWSMNDHYLDALMQACDRQSLTPENQAGLSNMLQVMADWECYREKWADSNLEKHWGVFTAATDHIVERLHHHLTS